MLVIRVEYAVMIEEPIHGRRYAHAPLGGRMSETLLEIDRIGRMQCLVVP